MLHRSIRKKSEAFSTVSIYCYETIMTNPEEFLIYCSCLKLLTGSLIHLFWQTKVIRLNSACKLYVLMYIKDSKKIPLSLCRFYNSYMTCQRTTLSPILPICAYVHTSIKNKKYLIKIK